MCNTKWIQWKIFTCHKHFRFGWKMHFSMVFPWEKLTTLLYRWLLWLCKNFNGCVWLNVICVLVFKLVDDLSMGMWFLICVFSFCEDCDDFLVCCSTGELELGGGITSPLYPTLNFFQNRETLNFLIWMCLNFQSLIYLFKLLFHISLCLISLYLFSSVDFLLNAACFQNR